MIETSDMLRVRPLFGTATKAGHAENRYYHQKEQSKFMVELNKTKIKIIRERKSHESQTQTYHVLFHDDKIYVSIRDIIKRMEESVKENTERTVRLKVDPILPEPKFKK